MAGFCEPWGPDKRNRIALECLAPGCPPALVEGDLSVGKDLLVNFGFLCSSTNDLVNIEAVNSVIRCLLLFADLLSSLDAGVTGRGSTDTAHGAALDEQKVSKPRVVFHFESSFYHFNIRCYRQVRRRTRVLDECTRSSTLLTNVRTRCHSSYVPWNSDS